MNTDEKNNKKPRHLTTEEIRNGCMYLSDGDDEKAKVCMITEEFKQGIEGVQPYKKSVTFYGGTRFNEGDLYYERTRALGARISKELGVTIMTGGGPGIMEAGNRGAYEAGGKSVGLTIKLPHEQSDNPYLTDSIPFYFFFARKVTLSYMSEVSLFFPGGFGTFDELFGILTLIQTNKIKRMPVILVGSEFWKPFDKIIREQMLEINKTISPEDVDIYKIIDNDDEIIEIIKNAEIIENNGL